jgi:signal transduction histidine kinase
MGRKSLSFLVLLSLYIFMQFIWWGILLISHSKVKTTMVIGEGSVFLLILAFGIWRLSRSIQKEFELGERQKNFLLSVTHELKTPISSAQLILQTLKKRSLPEEKKSDFINLAIQENKKSQHLIDHLLQAARLESQNFRVDKTHFNLQGFMDAFLSQFIETPIQVNYSENIDPSFSLFMDVALFESCMRNLLENSIKYGAKNIQLFFILKSKHILMEIKDDGEGISEKDRPNIFLKFYRSGDENVREKNGTGLGLFITKEFVHLNSGTIQFKPNEPKGSVFLLTFTL